MTSLGLFKYAGISGWGDLQAQDSEIAGVGTVGGDFHAEITNTASGSIEIEYGTTGQSFTVDWGSGTPTAYTAKTPSMTPTGTVIVESAEVCDRFRITGSFTTVTGVAITGGGLLEALNLAFTNMRAMTSFSLDDASNVTTIRAAWQNNFALTSFPNIAFPEALNIDGAWGGCTALTSFPAIAFPVATTAEDVFNNCNVMVSCGVTDFSSVENFISAFRDCDALTSLGNLETEAGTDFDNMFNGCGDLETIGAIDTTGTSGASTGMFTGCTSLTSPDSTEQSNLASASGYDFN